MKAELNLFNQMRENNYSKGISLISIIIAIVVIIILAGIVIFNSFFIVDEAKFAKFTNQVLNLQTVVTNECLNRKKDATLKKKSISDEQHYYMIAKGISLNDEIPQEIPSDEIDNIDTILSTLSAPIECNKYFEITSEETIKNLNLQEKYLDVAEKHYITDKGEVLVVPGFQRTNIIDISRFYITASKYYNGNHIEEPLYESLDEPQILGYNVILESVDNSKKLSLIKKVKEITGLGLKDSKTLVENNGSIIKFCTTIDEAEETKLILEEAGGIFKIESVYE